MNQHRNHPVNKLPSKLFMNFLFVVQTEGDTEPPESTTSAKARPRRSMGLGYILEDAQWLDEELDSE